MTSLLDARALEPSLLVAPSTSFSQIEAALRQCGFDRDERQTHTRSILPNEPELAGFRRQGRLPVITYTSNPVVSLRVLEVATLGPRLRAEIAARLPLLSRADLAAHLRASDPTSRLLGVFALRELSALELAPLLAPLADDPDDVVRSAAEGAALELTRVAAAQVRALAEADRVRERVEPLLRELALGDRELAQSLAPRESDYAQLFDAEVGARVAAIYLDVWRRPLRFGAGAPTDRLDCWVATAGMLRSDNALSRRFPLAYREIAGWLRPERTWVSWTWRPPLRATGVSFDGLVWLDGRWVYCPKPYRAIGEALAPAT